MSLDLDLLDQARHLAMKEPRRPKQASLRRAVSAAYYALFHLLVREASQLLAPRSPPHLRPLLARAFQHSEMRDVSRSFGSGGTLPMHHTGIQPSADLRRVASAFNDLQQARHDADYDPSKGFTRARTLGLIRKAQRAFEAWSRIRRDDEAKVYLTSLLAEKRWRR